MRQVNDMFPYREVRALSFQQLFRLCRAMAHWNWRTGLEPPVVIGRIEEATNNAVHVTRREPCRGRSTAR